jgi:hypothetical protein
MEFQRKNIETRLTNSIPGKTERYIFEIRKQYFFVSLGYGLEQCPVSVITLTM